MQNIFTFHLTQDLRQMVKNHLHEHGIYQFVVTDKVKDFCSCGSYMTLNFEKNNLIGKDGYADYELTCLSCGKMKAAKQYKGNKIPKHFLWVKDAK